MFANFISAIPMVRHSEWSAGLGEDEEEERLKKSGDKSPHSKMLTWTVRRSAGSLSALRGNTAAERRWSCWCVSLSSGVCRTGHFTCAMADLPVHRQEWFLAIEVVGARGGRGPLGDDLPQRVIVSSAHMERDTCGVCRFCRSRR